MRTKKTQAAARERKARVLAVLGEGRKTREQLAEQLGYGGKDLGNDLHSLRLAGKLARDPESKQWRLAGGSPIPEGDIEEAPSLRKGPPRRRAKALKGNAWDTKPAIVRDLYELRDRCGRAIDILEGRA